MKRKILVTGAAGFIGFHICKRLVLNGDEVIGFDNLNSYYDTNLKKARLNILKKYKKNWKFIKLDIEKEEYKIKEIFDKFRPNIVIHLAAQAGVRYSLENPKAYIKANLNGFYNIIEYSRLFEIRNFIYASSSSVYGGNTKVPFVEKDSTNHPVSIYAATKRSNELIAHSYSHLYSLPCTGLRFFTVYGPWGRPDMAPMIFAKAIYAKQPIKIFNNGNMSRDFTYIDDAVESIFKLIDKPAISDEQFNKNDPDPSKSWAPYQIVNIGNSNPINLMMFIKSLEKEIGQDAIKIFEPMQNGDIEKTYADTNLMQEIIGLYSTTNLQSGIKKFISWYKDFYKI